MSFSLIRNGSIIAAFLCLIVNPEINQLFGSPTSVDFFENDQEQYIKEKKAIVEELKIGDSFEHSIPAKAQEHYSRAEEMALDWLKNNPNRSDGSVENIQLLLSRSYRYNGIVFNVSGNSEKALEYLNLALSTLEMINDTSLLEEKGIWVVEKAKVLSVIGNVFSKAGNFEKALEYCQLAEELYSQANDLPGKAQTLNNKGIIYVRRLMYEQALDNFEKSLDIQQKLNNWEGIYQSLNNLSGVYIEMGSFDNAIELMLRALDIARQNGSVAGIAATNGNLGIAYRHKNDLKQALKSFSIAYDQYEKLSDYSGMALMLNNMGEMFLNEKNAEPALSYFERAYKLSLKTEDAHLRNACLNHLGNVYLLTGKPEKAVYYLEEASRIASENKYFHQQANAYRLLHETYAKMGDFQKAYFYSRLHTTINDSISVQKNISATKELEMKFMTGVKQQEIELLKKNAEIQELVLVKQKTLTFGLTAFGIVMLVTSSLFILKYRQKKRIALKLEAANNMLVKANEIIAESNKTKDKFFSIITHDLRSPFLGLVGLTDLMVQDMDNLEKEELRDYLTLTHRTAQNLFSLLENMLSWARLQTGKMVVQASNVNVCELVQEVKDVLENSAKLKEIGIHVQIEGRLYAYADRNMLLTILRNLISNAVKFSFPNQSIDVFAHKLENNQVEIFVKDHGTGISKDRIDKLFQLGQKQSTRGTSNEKGTGLGLVLVKEMIELMGGHIRVESEENKGSVFIFTLPGEKPHAA